eukprot:1181451-Prorocentrum_minimum.AAC.4
MGERDIEPPGRINALPTPSDPLQPPPDPLPTPSRPPSKVMWGHQGMGTWRHIRRHGGIYGDMAAYTATWRHIRRHGGIYGDVGHCADFEAHSLGIERSE